MKKFLALFLLVTFLTVCFLWVGFKNYANQINSEDSTEVIFEVMPGESYTTVIKDLESKGLIKSKTLFNFYAKITGTSGKIKVGEYSLRKNMLPSDILSIVNSGKSIGRKFTIPEGKNIYEIAEIFSKEGFGSQDQFLQLCKDKTFIKELLGSDLDSLEGYLFPETYSLTKYTDTKTTIANMVKKFQLVWSEIEPMTKDYHLNKHQIITLASIIEKETGASEERPLISSVFHNRMKKGMLLQTDPTVIYGKADLTGKVVISITRADLLAYTKYNTYVIKGLPPGPIANPSKESILATLNPATSDYLYFVSHNEGRHIFSKDYTQHVNAVKKFQLDPKAREGKSWRDLKKHKSPSVN